ncbi:MAG TPA: potassium channel family protein [Ohtaekwangia sp.]
MTIPSFRNIWKNDKGFTWMLAVTIITLISTQFTHGITGEGKFSLRLGFFLFTLIAVRSSSLSSFGKLIGYIISTATLILAVIMIGTEPPYLHLVYALLVTGYMIYIIALIVGQIFASQMITSHSIAGGVAVYIALGHVCSSLYLTIYLIQPDAFQYGGNPIPSDDAGRQLSYFSFVTLTTLGYGDITAVNPIARIVVMLEALLGQIFPAIFIAKLVSQHMTSRVK